MPSSFAARVGVVVSCSFLSLAISGCVAEGEDESETTAAELRGRSDGRGDGRGEHGHGHGHRPGRQDWQGRPHGRRHVENPTGVYVADVNVNGTGCPEGSWDVAISEDGETFTLRFSAYEATVAPGQALDVKDCQLDIKLTSPQGLSYSVASFYYQGYALLENNGMRARQTARYYFDGVRESTADRNEIRGPFDDSYLFTDEIGGGRRGWSRCGVNDTLHVQTRLALENDRGRTGTGYMNSATVDGTLAFKWKVQWRQCRP